MQSWLATTQSERAPRHHHRLQRNQGARRLYPDLLRRNRIVRRRNLAPHRDNPNRRSALRAGGRGAAGAAAS
ncbi:MAG: hypothetical protein M9936_13480 [Caldilinea sp.]|nr:hypothetical protein [Caldilineaceae bacterium]MCO5210699.1 hypothetical protein [Caldilinea sp.]MCW5844360.1 hypothetical protein [Caldilinea sp.]